MTIRVWFVAEKTPVESPTGHHVTIVRERLLGYRELLKPIQHGTQLAS